MIVTRRQLLQASIATAMMVSVENVVAAASAPTRAPDVSALQSGDFLWPKKPGAYIPYKLDLGQEVDADRDKWLEERDQFVAKARAGGDPELIAVADRVGSLSYNDFRSLYFRNQDPGAITPYSLGGIAAVGHVGIVQIDQAGQPWVVEALLKPGVVRSTYADWIAGRSGEIVWQGRLKGVAQNGRAKIATDALRWVSKPYDFWNFNLADTRGFYCSKLVWLCVMNSLQIAVDGDSNPKRRIWLSPKQVLYSQKIDRLYDPGEYGSD